MKKIIAAIVATAMIFSMNISAFAATVTDDSQLKTEVAKAGNIVTIGGDFYVNETYITADNVTIDGNGHTLTSANTNLKNATLANKSDNLTATFKNIILDGGGQTKTDTCLWMGRGSWNWYDVTVRNWNSSSKNNRGALTLGKSGSSPGKINMYGVTIINNHVGLSLDQSETVANIYGCDIEKNRNFDINLTAGTINFADDEEKTEKRVGKLNMSNGNLNISGNTSIEEIEKSGGTITVIGEITSDAITKVTLPQYGDSTIVAKLGEGVDGGKTLEHFVLSDEAPEGCTIDVLGRNIVISNEEDTSEGSVVTVDYSEVWGKSNAVAAGCLHAMDYKTSAKWLTDGINMNFIRGQAHQKKFDSNYEYVPGIFDEPTYERIIDNNPETKLMVGLYYGFKGEKGSKWQSAALENDGETWKDYIHDFMSEFSDKGVYSWIPWNEPDGQWGGKFATDFRTAFKYAYEAVKEYDEKAIVQGPETCKYSYSDLTGFLTYCKENNCVPDVLSWHELNSSRSDTEAHCKQLYNWLIENDIEPMPFAITEYQGTGYGTTDDKRYSQGNYNTGLGAAYIAGMERAEKYGFKFGLQSAWGLSGSNPDYLTDLGQMADFENGNMPTGLWYVYNAYRLMTGVKTAAYADYTDVECFATTDAAVNAERSVILVGNWKAEDKSVTVSLENIPEYLTKDGKVHIEAEIARETLAVASYGTEVLASVDKNVENGNCRIKLPVEARSAVIVKITPPIELEEGEKASSVKYETTGTMSAHEDDFLAVSGGKPSTYRNEETGERTYVETGDMVNFEVSVPKEGLYNLTVSHKKTPQNGFVQLYVDDVSTSTPTDMYGETQYEFSKNYGNIYLSEGKHILSFRIVGTGKNDASTGYDLTFGKIYLSPISSDAEKVISFDCADDILVKSGTAPEYLPIPEKEGYVFDGWKTSDGEEITEDCVINDNMELFADWRAADGNKVKVYVSNGTSDVDEIYADSGDMIEINVKPDDENYVPQVKANGEEQRYEKTEDGYKVTIEVTEETVVLVSFVPPYDLQTAYSRADYKTLSLNKSYTDLAVFEYEITPFSVTDGLVAFCGSENTPNSWNSFNAIIRLRTDGTMDARNGASFEAENTFSYTVGNTYKIRVAIDVANKKYSVWVYDNGKETIIAIDYSFRNDSPTTDNIGKICVRGGDKVAAEQFRIENFREVPTFEIVSCDREKGQVKIAAEKAENAVLICAVYNGEALAEVKEMNVTLAVGENVIDFEEVKNENISLMLWRDISSLSPLCKKFN